MTGLVRARFTRRLGGRISASPLLVDANDDGWPEIVCGGEALWVLGPDGHALPRWPRPGRRPFASSAAFGDIQGDGRGEIVAGCDDGLVYAFYTDGERVPGWPVRTGADVFSTPCLADLDGDGCVEVVVGSDDGTLYVLRGDGQPWRTTTLPGHPFVSASPTAADLNADGRLEVVVGAWDRTLRSWSPGSGCGPQGIGRAGHVIWSSATAFELKGEGVRLAWAADRAYVSAPDGSVAPGWPRRTESWIVSSPAVAELRPGDGPSVLVGAERMYAWDLLGHRRPGWPARTEDYVWSSPIAFDLDGDGRREVIVGSWDGRVYGFRADGSPIDGFPLRTGGPVFATPAAAPVPEGGGILVAASWDGTLRAWDLPLARFAAGDWLQFRGSARRTGLQPTPFRAPSGDPAPAERPDAIPVLTGAHLESWAGLQRAVLEGDGLGGAPRIELGYEIAGERRRHPVPVVNSEGRFVGLFQPLLIPRRIAYRIEVEDVGGRIQTWPTSGTATFRSRIPGFDVLRRDAPAGRARDNRS